jgi:hypothetical protein
MTFKIIGFSYRALKANDNHVCLFMAFHVFSTNNIALLFEGIYMGLRLIGHRLD